MSLIYKLTVFSINRHQINKVLEYKLILELHQSYSAPCASHKGQNMYWATWLLIKSEFPCITMWREKRVQVLISMW